MGPEGLEGAGKPREPAAPAGMESQVRPCRKTGKGAARRAWPTTRNWKPSMDSRASASQEPATGGKADSTPR